MAAFEDRTSPDLDQFKGGKWTDWLNAIQSSEPKQQGVPEHHTKRNIEVARLRRPDMGLFGYRPATDKFYLVVCEHCGHLVKPQSLNIHYERKHKNKRITRLPSSSHARLLHAQSKHIIDKSNHRLLPPPHTSKQPGTSLSHQKTSHVLPASERGGSDVIKSEPIPEKSTMAATSERRHVESNNSRNHRTVKSGTKLIAPQPAKVPAGHDNVPNQVRLHQPSKKSIHKPGGTIQLNEIPESHLKSSSRHSMESKHPHRHHRTSSSKSLDIDPAHPRDHKKTMADSHTSASKSRKNHDGYHHHYHQMPGRDSCSDNNPISPDSVKLLSPGADSRISVPLVVLEKTQVSSGGKSNQAYKRSRPVSGGSESSLSPPRHKVPALHSLTDDKGPQTSLKAPDVVQNAIVPAKVKKKEKKILPLKDREYDPNKHCGVWVKDENSHCRRSLTCKVHPLNAKRAVTGRCKEFDELIQERGREKQRLKEKAAAAVPAPPASFAANAIKSPPAPSPVEFAVPSPAPKATPLSPPVCTTVTSPASQSLTTAQKMKSSISLFPRNFNAWHVDCWDNDEVPDDSTTAKLQNNCTCIQRHPQPITVLEFQSRKSGTCQVSYDRRVERQLEALSSNFQKFGNKPPKTPKPFSFSPISGATYRSSNIGVPTSNSAMHVFNQVPQRTAANTVFMFNQPQRAVANISYVNATQKSQRMSQIASLNNGIQMGKMVPKTARNNSLNRRLSNLAPPDGPESQVKRTKADAMIRYRSRSEQVLNVLKRTASNSGDVGFVTQANDLHSTSPLFFLNNSKETASSPMQVPIVANVSNANSSLVSLHTTMPSSEDRKRSTTSSAKLKSKSAIPKYSTITHPHTQAARTEHVDGTPILVQLPNGLNPISGNVLLKPGSHSVTLSGNIGALTVTGEDPNFSGSKLSKKLKNLNSNNNFIVQGDGISPTPLLAESKQVMQPQLSQASVSHAHQPVGGTTVENFLLQNDEHFLLNPQSSENVPVLNTVNLNQQYAIQNSNFSHSVTLDQQTQGQSNSSATADILRVLCSPAENCDTLQVKLEKHNPPQLGNMNQIDPAILEQVFGNQTAAIPHGRLSVDATQGCSTSNATRTSDLGQNFISR